jgi:hypothetical protein
MGALPGAQIALIVAGAFRIYHLLDLTADAELIPSHL